MFPLETDYCRLGLDETQKVAMLSWKRPVHLSEYQSGLSALIDLLKTHAIQRTLIDSTHKGPLSKEADEWVFNALPNAVAGIDLNVHQVALVMTEDMYQNMVQQYSVLRTGALQLPLSINYFTKREEALHWLAHEPTMLS
ncbi:hypothetical protein [Rufibacter sp. LB8]|uniref:hypothetical protein n=1 Tax=Rufibacter sp. LB8 TaxID=2777781 RepID=UPI00178C4BFA|nr:hypothetical protein [Rufibacter sp. LB8]